MEQLYNYLPEKLVTFILVTLFSLLIGLSQRKISLKREGETTLSFEMYTRQENPFGVVFRILTDSNKNIDLYYTANEHLKRYPIFVVGENIYPLADHIIYDQWVPIQLSLIHI